MILRRGSRARPPIQMFRLTMLALACWCAAPTAGSDGRELFPLRCATCHGSSGGCDGPLVARVRSRMPPTPEASPDESRVRFGPEPRIVRGFLPPRPGESDPITRGLVVGLSTEFALEYHTGDFRLMRVLVGGDDGVFVDRTDWRGRGGTALQLLGESIDEMEEADFGTTLSTVPDRVPLEIDLTDVRVIGDSVRFDGRVFDGDAEVARYVEFVRALTLDGDATGFHRRIEIHDARVPRSLRVVTAGMLLLTAWRHERSTVRGLEIWYGGRQPDGMAELIGFRGPQIMKGSLSGGAGKVVVPVGDRPFTRIDVVRVRRRTASLLEESVPVFAEGFDR